MNNLSNQDVIALIAIGFLLCGIAVCIGWLSYIKLEEKEKEAKQASELPPSDVYTKKELMKTKAAELRHLLQQVTCYSSLCKAEECIDAFGEAYSEEPGFERLHITILNEYERQRKSVRRSENVVRFDFTYGREEA